MNNSLNIYVIVDDNSPFITYFPFGDTFGIPDQSAGWIQNPHVADSGLTTSTSENQRSQGNSLHLTSLDGASFSIQWSGTGIQLFGSCLKATYNISLDGAYTQASSFLSTDSLLAEFHDLSYANHTLTLTVHTTPPPTSDSHIAFDKAVIISAPRPSDNCSTFVSQIAHNHDIAFQGQWSFVSTPGKHGRNHSFHQSTHAGDRFEFTFQGRTVTLYGLVSADCGLYSVTLDNETTSLSARSSAFDPHTLLFYATDLDDDVQHQLIVQNEENRTLAVGARGLNYTSCLLTATNSLTPLEPSTSPVTISSHSQFPAGPVVGAILSGQVFVAIVVLVLCAWRRRRRKQSAHDVADVNVELDHIPSSLSNVRPHQLYSPPLNASRKNPGPSPVGVVSTIYPGNRSPSMLSVTEICYP